MTNIGHGNGAGPVFAPAGCGRSSTDERVTVTCAVVGLTNFGERPVPSTRLAEVLGRPVREAEVPARQWGWPGTQVADGLITVSPERARPATRRQVQIGDRRFGVTGCACDIFWAAPLADFMAGWDKRLQENEQLPVGIAILVLTNTRRAGRLVTGGHRPAGASPAGRPPAHGFCDDEETRRLLRSRPPRQALAWAAARLGGIDMRCPPFLK